MKKKRLSCNQINAILIFYVENTLNILLRKLVKEHLESCPECMANYLNILEKYNIKNKQENTKFDSENFETEQYKIFKTNLSAYIDNELPVNENVKIKKISISNPIARKDLENIYKFKNLLFKSFEKTKENLKFDYSKSVLNAIQKDIKSESALNTYNIVWILISALLSSIIVGFFILYS